VQTELAGRANCHHSLVPRQPRSPRFPAGLPFRSVPRNEKGRALADAAFPFSADGKDQRPVRARARIMKASKVNSATCHHRYCSERVACIASMIFLKSAFFALISA